MKKVILVCILHLFCGKAISQNIDIDLLEEINSDRNPSYDPTFRFITNTVSPLTLGAPIGFVTYALVRKDSASAHRAVIVFSSLAFSGIINTGLKYMVHRTRPYVSYNFIQKETAGGGYSFPSGHTSAAFSLATSISIVYPKWYVIAPSFLWASAVGYSRMELGVHYPSDVLVGAIVGSASSLLSYKLNKWIKYQKKNRRK